MTDITLPPEAMQDKAAEAAEFMRLFSTPSRLMLLCHIAEKERSVGEIQDELDFKQPALSQQLAELRQAGVVRTRRESRQIYYSIADDRVAVVMDMLMRMFCATQPPAPKAEQTIPRPTATISRSVVQRNFPGEMALWARLEPAE
jgi:DNA-binding transcriptional ArsR family regulator